MSTLLKLDNVYANIGQFEILQGVSLTVPAMGVTVLLGRNGAGKTTTLRTIMGYLQPRQGSIEFRGASVVGLPTHRISRMGIGYLPEEGHIFHNLTVQENLHLAMQTPDSQAKARIDQAISLFPDLGEAWKRHAGTLSGGQRQMLAMATLLVGAQPLLLIDEPSKGLSPAFVKRLIEIIRLLKGTTTVLLVEQNFYLASQVADSFVIIDDGHTVLSGDIVELTDRPDWQQQYLGLFAAGGVS